MCMCLSQCCEDSDCSDPTCEECVNCQCQVKPAAQCAHWSDCAPCHECVDCECENQCSASQCCDNEVCIDKCDQSGYCIFQWLPVGVPGTGCQNLDPLDTSCTPLITNAICAWVTSQNYHLNSAECASCASSCSHIAGQCVELTPWLCHNEGIIPICMCNGNATGTPQNAGIYYECN